MKLGDNDYIWVSCGLELSGCSELLNVAVQDVPDLISGLPEFNIRRVGQRERVANWRIRELFTRLIEKTWKMRRLEKIYLWKFKTDSAPRIAEYICEKVLTIIAIRFCLVNTYLLGNHRGNNVFLIQAMLQ